MTNVDSDSREVRIEDAPGGTIILKDCIVRIEVMQKAEYTLQDAIKVVSLIDDLRKGQRLPLLVDFTNVRYLSRPVREFYSSEEVSEKVSALAIISSSTIGRMIGNFFMGINSPHVPTRFMPGQKEALDWLKGYLK